MRIQRHRSRNCTHIFKSNCFILRGMSKKSTDPREEALAKFLVSAVGEVEAKDFDDLTKKLEHRKKEDGDGDNE